MKRKTFRRLCLFFLLEALICLAAGYWLAPAAPWVFAHMGPGSFLSEYRTEDGCQDARRAFAAGRRHGPTRSLSHWRGHESRKSQQSQYRDYSGDHCSLCQCSQTR